MFPESLHMLMNIPKFVKFIIQEFKTLSSYENKAHSFDDPSSCSRFLR